MENYEQKYKAALGWMQSLYKGLHGTTKEDAEHYFPELKESEDEKIRKELIQYLKDYPNLPNGHYCRDDFFAWLEKQDEQKPADNVKSKFKVGDWVIKDGVVAQILDNQQYAFVGLDTQGNDFICNYGHVDSMRPWTIQDAKDGDVLCSGNPFIFMGFGDKRHPNNPTAYCGICSADKFILSDRKSWWTANKVNPATKEQRDLLFQKMNEAGYEWDAEKKELKKIKQNNTAWSKEDKEILDGIIDTLDGLCLIDSDRLNWLKSIKDRVQPQSKQEWSEYDKIQLSEAIQMIKANGTWIRSEDAVKKVSNWLNSLKPNWKPSEEQMAVLKNAIHFYGKTVGKEVLEALYNDLKNL